ncbi:MAG: hypothetical protein R3Y53_05775 [Bacillota bacterium]
MENKLRIDTGIEITKIDGFEEERDEDLIKLAEELEEEFEELELTRIAKPRKRKKSREEIEPTKLVRPKKKDKIDEIKEIDEKVESAYVVEPHVLEDFNPLQALDAILEEYEEEEYEEEEYEEEEYEEEEHEEEEYEEEDCEEEYIETDASSLAKKEKTPTVEVEQEFIKVEAPKRIVPKNKEAMTPITMLDLVMPMENLRIGTVLGKSTEKKRKGKRKKRW